MQVFLIALAFGCALAGDIQAEVSVDFSAKDSVVGVFKTTATLQVVSNPLLDRRFTLPNGTSIPNPIHKAAWSSLKALGADHIRFQPWFPYPHKSVAELEPPTPGKPTSWNFTSFLPQMLDFMDSTAGHPVIWNIGTIPCWMFWGPTTNHSHCPFPSNPDTSDFGYGTRGIRPFFLRDKSGEMLADYYARLMSYLVNGYMVDEHEVIHTGGPKINFSAKAGHIFEFLNEGEHYYSPKEYVHDYDVTVPAIQTALGDGAPSFMGIGGCHDGFWNWWFMPNCTIWLNEFLDRSNHKVADIPIDYASIHYYATTKNRSDVGRYTQDFFGSADKWLVKLDEHVIQRDRLSPKTKLALTELGILMVDDMTHTYGSDGGLPDMFFNAAASFWAYVFTHVSMKGIDIACFSQFVGSPPIAKWGINDMQFPSGTMISWETGLGNAKYWVLKLFIDHLQKGDIMQKTTTTMVADESKQSAAPAEYICEAVGPWTFNNEITLTCNDPHARIERIWADSGVRPLGECGHYEPNRNCSNHLLATAWAGVECLGRHSCTLKKESKIADFFVCPVSEFVYKDVSPLQQVLSIQARCTGDKGGHTSEEYTGDSVFSGAFTSPDGKTKKLLLINKLNQAVTVKVTAAELGKNGAKAYIVDPESVSRGSAQGIREETWAPQFVNSSTVVTLQPYAVAFAIIDDGASTSASIVI